MKTIKTAFKKILRIGYLIIKYFKIFRLIIKYPFYIYSIKVRSRLSIFSVDKLSADIILNPIVRYSENSLYGHNNLLKKLPYLKKIRSKKYIIEHAYYFGDFYPHRYLSYDPEVIITYSERRVKRIKSSLYKNSNFNDEKIVITIGPYINYVKGLMKNKERFEIFRDFGRILLVFPMHSIEGVQYDFDHKMFDREIEKKAREFDSVFVCMYWKDIQDRRHEIYKSKNYIVVTAGHRNDLNFLRRLKDIISISSMTMSNKPGTHIGYCTALGKPHYLFNQDYIVYGENVEKEFKEKNSSFYLRSVKEEKTEIIEAFSTYFESLTRKQKKVAEKYWGKDKISSYKLNKYNT